MESDWSVAAAADDPLIETTWSDAQSGLAWSDLRAGDEFEQQRRIAALPEAALSPAMKHALTLLNTPCGLLLTAKCDRWLMSEDERADHADLLGVSAMLYGYGSYIDVLIVHPLPLCDFFLHEEWARAVARTATAVSIDNARMEIVIRPAHHADVWGFGLSVYCFGAGADQATAESVWSACLDAVIPILIRKIDELVPVANKKAQQELSC